jgi:hypothetical protein
MARRRRRRFDRQAEKGAGGLFLACLAEDQQPDTGGAGFQAEAPAFGEAELLGVPVHF